jgi:hypothetical protein
MPKLIWVHLPRKTRPRFVGSALLALVAVGVALSYAATAIAEVCPNEQARNEDGGLSLSLPDCRAYEQASPVDKEDQDVSVLSPSGSTEGASIEGYEQPFLSSADGNAVVYVGGASTEGNGEIYRNVYVSTRGSESWQARGISPVGREPTYVAFSSDLTVGLLSYALEEFQASPPLETELPGGYRYKDLYLRVPSETSRRANVYVPVVGAPTNRARSSSAFQILFEGASEDLSRVVFEANEVLTKPTAVAPEPMDPGEKDYDLYEWAEGGQRLVNVLPGNEAASLHASIAGGSHDVSSDGSRIYWYDNQGRLYLRENGENTFEVDASEVPEGEGGKELKERESRSGGGSFFTASMDGSRAFFTDGKALTSNAVEGSGSNLYEYLVGGERHLMDLTPGASADVQGVLGASENGSYVYFVARGDLAKGATAGGDNLYLWEDGATRFIATLSFPGGAECGSKPNECANKIYVEHIFGNAVDQNYVEPGLDVWSSNLSYKVAEVSPDGRYLVFMSKASLTGYQNTRSGALGEKDGERVSEVYLYDATANRLMCASCIPDGARPVGESYLPPSESVLYQPAYITDSGRVFFDSQEALLSDAMNGATGVYEYENGQLYLISYGLSVGSSYFDAANVGVPEQPEQGGDDVFFTTKQRLVAADQDEQADLYDARVDGGFTVVGPVPTCDGEAGCLGSFRVQLPVLGVPTSTSLSGLGSGVGVVETSAVSSKPNTTKRTKAKVRRKKDKTGKRVKKRARVRSRRERKR